MTLRNQLVQTLCQVFLMKITSKKRKSNQIILTSALHRPQTYLSMKLLQITSPYFDAMILSDENNFQKTKIKSLEEEIRKFKNENNTLRENILIQLKIIKTLSGNNERKTNIPIKNKTKKNNDFKTNNSNRQTTHSTKNSNKRQRGSIDIHFETSNKFAPLLMANIDDFTTCKLTNITSANSKKPHQKPLFSNNDKSVRCFEKKRPDGCVTRNYIKNLLPVTTPGNSNYASVSKNGRKILVIGDSHVERIRRIDFDKELRNAKAYFRSFSGVTSTQRDHNFTC